MAMNNLRQRLFKSKKSTSAQKRRLISETLENRQLLAADMGTFVPVADNLHHNYRDAYDTNGDGKRSPIDALVVLNHVNQNVSGEMGSALDKGLMLDVNNDGRIQPIDALVAINHMQQGEGETLLLGLKLDITQNGVSLLRDGSGAVTGREANIAVGDKFDLEVLVDDLRSPFTALGAFTVYADIMASSAGSYRPVLSETQIISVSENLIDGTGGDVVISAPGRGSATISFLDFATNQETAIQSALENELGYGGGNVTVFQGSRVPRDTTTDPDTPGGPFQFFIRYTGDNQEFVDVPNVTFDTSGLTGANITSTVTEIPVFLNNDPSQINPNAFQFNIDFRSRSVNNAIVYSNNASGSFDPNGVDVFDEIGGTGPVDPGGIRAFAGAQGATFSPTDLEAFSIEIEAVSAAQDLTFSLNLPESDGTALTLYGLDDELTPMEISIDLNDTPGIADDGQGLVVLNFVEGVTAAADAINTNEDVAGSVNVLANDVDNTGGTLSVALESGASNGQVTFDGSVFTYTPNTDFFGSDSFTYRATSTNGGSSVGTVNVTVNSVNDAPNAVADTLPTTDEGVAVDFTAADLIGNDTGGPANENETVSLVSVATSSSRGGTIVDNGGGNFTYTPATGVTGTDTFTYVVQDSNNIPASSTGTVSINISDVPSAPVAVNDTISAVEDTAFSGSIQDLLLANDTDPDGNNTISFDSFGGNNVVNNGDGTFTYTPPANVFGTSADSFTYTIRDNTSPTPLTSTATVNVNISGVNDAPVAVADQLSADEATNNVILDVLANDSPGPNETENIFVEALGSTTTTQGGTVSITSGDGSVTYSPPSATFLGEDTFTYTIRDADGVVSNSATVTVNVVPTIRPRAINDSVTTNEDTQVSFNVINNDLPNTGATVTFVGFDNSTIANGTLTGTGGDFTYVPNTDFFGTETFTYTISDTSGGTVDQDAATGTVTITVNGVNDPPVFGADPTFTTAEDTPLTLNGNATNNDSAGPANENQSVSIVAPVSGTSNSGGTLAVSGGVLTYTPAADFFGTDSFTYTISDGEATATATATVNVTAVNDVPTVVDQNVDASENDPLVITGLLNGATGGPSNESQTVTLLSVDTTSAQGGTITNNNDGTFTYNPATNFSGADSFTFTAQDDGNATAIGTININVIPDNPLPTANDDAVTAFVGLPLTIETASLLANDTDPDNELLSFVSASGTNVVDNGDGTLTYTAPATGTTDTFTYTITDGTSQVSATVNVTIAQFQPSTISGRLFIDQVVDGNRNGAYNEGETELGGIMVHLSGTTASGTPINVQSTMTNAEGEYRFANVAPGVYDVTFTSPDGVVQDTSTLSTQQVEIAAPGGATSERDFAFAAFDPMGAMLERFSHSYRLANPGMATGNEGLSANFNSQGVLQYVNVGIGFDNVEMVTVGLNGNQVSLTFTDASGAETTVDVPEERRLIMDNGSGGTLVRVFGDFADFTNAGLVGEGEASDYSDAVDQVLGA